MQNNESETKVYYVYTKQRDAEFQDKANNLRLDSGFNPIAIHLHQQDNLAMWFDMNREIRTSFDRETRTPNGTIILEKESEQIIFEQLTLSLFQNKVLAELGKSAENLPNFKTEEEMIRYFQDMYNQGIWY